MQLNLETRLGCQELGQAVYTNLARQRWIKNILASDILAQTLTQEIEDILLLVRMRYLSTEILHSKFRSDKPGDGHRNKARGKQYLNDPTSLHQQAGSEPPSVAAKCTPWGNQLTK
jgi:hypothetical protein